MELGESSFPRRQTRQVMVGNVPVGGGAPISVQSMTITKTADVEGTLQQIYALAAAGADIVRCTCNEEAAAVGLAEIVPRQAGSKTTRSASAPGWMAPLRGNKPNKIGRAHV